MAPKPEKTLRAATLASRCLLKAQMGGCVHACSFCGVHRRASMRHACWWTEAPETCACARLLQRARTCACMRSGTIGLIISACVCACALACETMRFVV
eukprot:2505815-Pleurochrysis_carterae.AAC.1